MHCKAHLINPEISVKSHQLPECAYFSQRWLKPSLHYMSLSLIFHSLTNFGAHRQSLQIHVSLVTNPPWASHSFLFSWVSEQTIIILCQMSTFDYWVKLQFLLTKHSSEIRKVRSFFLVKDSVVKSVTPSISHLCIFKWKPLWNLSSLDLALVVIT